MINLLENTYERINIKTHFKLHNYLNRHDIVVLCKNKIFDYKSKFSSKNENVSFLIDTTSPNIKISNVIPCAFIGSYVIWLLQFNKCYTYSL